MSVYHALACVQPRPPSEKGPFSNFFWGGGGGAAVQRLPCFRLTKLFLFYQQSFCLYLFFYCTSLNLIQGIPINDKSSRDRQSRSRVAKSVTHLHVVGNAPTNRVRAQLLSRTGYFLEILADGTIHTTLNNSSNYSKWVILLKIVSAVER